MEIPPDVAVVGLAQAAVDGVSLTNPEIRAQVVLSSVKFHLSCFGALLFAVAFPRDRFLGKVICWLLVAYGFFGVLVLTAPLGSPGDVDGRLASPEATVYSKGACSVAVGADGLLVEVHNNPDRALSDGMQSLFPDQFDELMAEIRQIAAVVHRNVPLAAVRTQPAATR